MYRSNDGRSSPPMSLFDVHNSRASPDQFSGFPSRGLFPNRSPDGGLAVLNRFRLETLDEVRHTASRLDGSRR